MRILFAAVAALALSGCGIELLATTATTSTLQAQQLDAVRGQVQHAAGTSGKINLQKAIDTFHAEKGHYPATLEELAPAYIATVPLQTDGKPYVYNPATGRISEGAFAGPTPEDMQQMQALANAIQQFGRQVRRYPPSLDALVPRFLPAVPTTSAGEPYLYDPRTGRIAHPQAVAPQPGQPNPGYAGGGPMGEAMTGIQMQRQMNFNNAGANAAGNRADDASRGFGNARTQHQMDTMDDLGL